MIQPKRKYNECTVNNTTLAKKKIVTHELVFHSKQKAHQMYCNSVTIIIQPITSRKHPNS